MAPAVQPDVLLSSKRQIDVDDISFMSTESLNFAQATMQRVRKRPAKDQEEMISMRSSGDEESLR